MAETQLTVLVVDDNEINRRILGNILLPQYRVVEAENGQKAISCLESGEQPAAILLDIIMPVMNGYEFLAWLKTSALSPIPVIAITGDSDSETEQKTLDLGAWDFVSKPYQPKTLLTRLKNVIERSQFYLLREMRHAYEYDALTGLFNRTMFFSETQTLLEGYPDERFAMIRIDIERFHTYNTFFGEEEGNRLLRYVADSLRRSAAALLPCTYGRIHADVFCLCCRYDKARISVQASHVYEVLAQYNAEYRLDPIFGIYVIEDHRKKVQGMYELATLATLKCKAEHLSRIAYYEPELGERAIAEQSIINDMQAALDLGQFEVYFQPKFDLETEKPYGAEALVRWRHPVKGLLSPGMFIPILEHNGFIGKVDRYIWEEVCRCLSRWTEQGLHPGPVSVNVSRVNMYNPGLTDFILGLTQKYRIAPELLQLEVTESAYTENPAVMEQSVRSLQDAGFCVLMDDFGSGYSSLNTLKDIPVDVLKIDMQFLAGTANGRRSECILASVIRMAGWLGMPVVMEGVETRQQVDFLKSIGCGYVQGYYFAKPMPCSQYEALLNQRQAPPAPAANDNLGVIAQAVWYPDPQVLLIFDSMEHPAGIYEFENGNIHTLRVNAEFLSEFGYGTDIDYHVKPMPTKVYLSEESSANLKKAFSSTAENRADSVCRFTMTVPGGGSLSMKARMKYWGHNGAAAVIFTQFSRECDH